MKKNIAILAPSIICISLMALAGCNRQKIASAQAAENLTAPAAAENTTAPASAAENPTPAAGVDPAAVAPQPVTLPAGTRVRVRLQERSIRDATEPAIASPPRWMSRWSQATASSCRWEPSSPDT